MKAHLQFLTLLLLLISLSGSVAQVFTLQPGTDSKRLDANGNPTNTYHDMTPSWDSSPYLEFNLDDGQAYSVDMNFRLLPPVGYNAVLKKGDPGYKEYPLTIFFHGAGEAGISRSGYFNYASTDPRYLNNDHNLYHGGKQHLDAVKRNPSDTRAFPGFVLIPQMRSGWYDSDKNASIIIIEKVIEKFSIDKNRVYIQGLSAGGRAVWDIAAKRPDLFAAILPISAAPSSTYDFTKILEIPVWQFQGGIDDLQPATVSRSNITKLKNLGGTPRYTEYPKLGHAVWNAAWADAEFFSWMLSRRKNEIAVYFGKTDFCQGEAISAKLALTAGFSGYEWRRNGQLIAGATGNNLNVTQIGSYTARFRRGTEWTDWSSPVEIKVKIESLVPVVTALSSTALPSLDGKNSVILSAPAGFSKYKWSNNASTQNITVNAAGSYSVVVTPEGGCPTQSSVPVTVTVGSTAGTPVAPASLSASSISETKINVKWNDQSNNESGFEIYRSLQSSAGYTFIKLLLVNTVSFDDSELDANTTYFYKVRAINTKGGSTAIGPVSSKTNLDIQAPSAPGNLRPGASTQTSVQLLWNAATDNVGVVDYLIYKGNVHVGTSIATTYTVEGLTHEEVYNFTVKARDKSGNVSNSSNQITQMAVSKGLYYKQYIGGTWSTVASLDSWAVSDEGFIRNFIIAPEPTGVRKAINVDYFGFNFAGYIYINTAGTYTFYVRSDDGSVLWIDGKELVNNDGVHVPQEKSATIYLTAGPHQILLKYFDRTNDETLTVSYSGPGIAKQAIPDHVLTSSQKAMPSSITAPSNLIATNITSTSATITWKDNSTNETGFEVYRATSSGGPFTLISTTGANVSSYNNNSLSSATSYYFQVRAIGSSGGASGFSNIVSATTLGGPVASVNGVNYSYYEGNWSLLPNFSSLAPKKAGVIPNFSLSQRMTTSYFAFKYDAEIQIDVAGTYTFYTSSDDGSNMFINSQKIVDNDGLHGTTEKSGSVYLPVGRHDINVNFFQKTGGSVLSVSYSGPGISKKLIPDQVLFIPQDAVASSITPPSNLLASNVTSSGATLSWRDNSSNESGFEVHRAISSDGPFTLAGTVGANSISFNINSLSPATNYYFQVRAIGSSGSMSAFSNTTSVTTSAGPITSVNGVNYAYYEGMWNVLPNFSALTPNKSGIISDFSLSPKIATSYYSFKYDAEIQIDVAGTYTFYTSSDDGSNLFINSQKIVDNDGLHGVVEKSGSIYLSTGRHNINVNFFQKTGGSVLTVSYAGPGITKKVIPSTILYPSTNSVKAEGTIIAARGGNSLNVEEEIKTLGISLTVYPNPFVGYISLNLPEIDSEIKVQLFTNSGILLFEKEFINSTGEIYMDVEDLILSEGIYFMKVTTPSVIKNIRMIKKLR